MINKFVISFILILFFFSITNAAYAAEDGILNGRLVNKTAGGGSVSKMKVTLDSSRGNSSLPSSSTGTNDKGIFEFKGLPTGKEYTYKMTVKYQDVDYTSDDISFKEGEKVKEVDLIVYDATSDNKGIKINLSHIIVFPGEGSLQAQEYYALNNSSDKSYVGSRIIPSVNQKETFRTNVPGGARSFQYQMGLMECCVALEEGSLIDTMAIIPGIKEMAFSYGFPYKSREYTINKTSEYPIATLNFIVEDRGIAVSGGGLAPQGRVDIEGKNFLVFTRKNIEPGEKLAIKLSGLPAPSLTGSIKWWALGFILLAVIGAIFYPRLRKGAGMKPVPIPASEREKLIREIAKLDDDFEAGRIPEGAYKRLRAQKKAHLVDLTHNKGRR